MDLSEVKQSITCSICMDIATLPVHSTCCENAKSRPPACLICVRSYLQLNEPYQRRTTKKSWSGCECDIIPTTGPQKHYTHTIQLDSIRNLFGKSKCPHKDCGAECSTSAELRRHLGGRSNTNDKFGNCPQAMTRCNKCGFFGKRHIVEGEHFREFHDNILCPLCMSHIPLNRAAGHYETHVRSLQMMKQELIHKNVLTTNDLE